jgi:hypothetical protein
MKTNVFFCSSKLDLLTIMQIYVYINKNNSKSHLALLLGVSQKNVSKICLKVYGFMKMFLNILLCF